MKELKNLIIVISLMSVIIVSAMNGVLFITHPELTYGTPGMYHIAVIFMLIAISLVYLLTRIEYKFILSNTRIRNLWSFGFNHQTIFVNITVQVILYFILSGLGVLDPSASIVIPVVILFITFIWLRTVTLLYLKYDQYLSKIYLHFISNLIFIGVTVYMAIQLFLYINLN